MIVLCRSLGFTWIPRTTSSISLIFFPLDNFERNVNTSSNLLRLLEEFVEKAENKSCWEVSKLAGMMINASTSWLGMSWNRTLFSAIRSDMIIPWHTSETVLNVEMIASIESYVCMEIILFTFKTIKEKRLISSLKIKSIVTSLTSDLYNRQQSSDVLYLFSPEMTHARPPIKFATPLPKEKSKR